MATVVHIVMFRFRPEITQEHKETFQRELKKLKSLSCVKDHRLLVGGPSVTDPISRSQGYHCCLVSYHHNLKALEEYQASREHHEVTSKFVWPFIDDVCRFDFEVPPEDEYMVSNITRGSEEKSFIKSDSVSVNNPTSGSLQCKMLEFPASNLTLQMLQAASKGRYAVGAYNCYNDDGVIAVIRASEKKKSPAIIQLFPWTLHFQGPEFVKYVVRAAHSASVPIAVHLDHCIKQEDIDVALTLPFDSIMIDASTLDEDDNVALCAENIRRASRAGITVEVETGRIEGGEDGLPKVDQGAIYTDPQKAREFMSKTGAHFLAPSFGNIHGCYPPGGAEKSWDLTLLKSIQRAVTDAVPIAVHGTYPVSDELFSKVIACEVSKINVNRTVRDEYTKFVAESAGKLELTTLKAAGVDIYTKSVERVMDLFGSSGKAA